MAETDTNKPPGSLEELEAELTKGELSPELTRVESIDDDNPPPDPRAGNPDALPRLPREPSLDDKLLETAAEATEQTDDAESDAPLPTRTLHLEANPNAPRKPFYKRKRFWGAIILLAIIGGALAWFIRPSRLVIVNTLGLRTPVNITTGTVPEAGQQSGVLKTVAVTVNGEALQTNDEGKLQTTASYGPAEITAKKPGYADATHNVLLDFDPFFYLLGGKKADDDARNVALQLKAVGIPLKIQAKDWLSDQPLTAGTYSVGDVVAKANDQGKVQLVLPATDAKTAKVKAVFGGSYIDKEFDIALDGNEAQVTFVPAGKDYFVSTRGGARTIYSSNLDGSETAPFIEASALETSAMNFTVSPSGKFGVLASTRDGKKDSQGVLLQQVYVVDLTTKKLTSVDNGQWVHFVDWLGDSLVYVVGERPAGAASVTQRLAAVNVASAKQVTLGTGDTFGAVRLAVDSVIYQVNHPASDPEAGTKNPELRVVPVKGGTEKNLGYLVQQLAQINHDTFAYRKADGSWSEYNVNTSQNKNASAPADVSRAYLAATSSDGQNRLIISRADGKVVLTVRNVANNQEKVIYSNAQITGPVRFVGNVVVFRQDSADYAIPIGGGTPKKINSITEPSDSFTLPAGYFPLI